MIKSEKEPTLSFIFISFIYQVSRRNASKQKLDENWIEHFFFLASFCLFVNLRKFDKIVGSGIVCLIQINLMKEKRRGKPGDNPSLIRPKLLRNTNDRTNIQKWLVLIYPSILGITRQISAMYILLRKVTMQWKLCAGVNCRIMLAVVKY